MYWVFQPINYVSNGELFGFEALCRWDSPKLGPLIPELFIQVAEDLNMVQIIDFWTLKAVESAYRELTVNGGHVIVIGAAVTAVVRAVG